MGSHVRDRRICIGNGWPDYGASFDRVDRHIDIVESSAASQGGCIQIHKYGENARALRRGRGRVLIVVHTVELIFCVSNELQKLCSVRVCFCNHVDATYDAFHHRICHARCARAPALLGCARVHDGIACEAAFVLVAMATQCAAFLCVKKIVELQNRRILVQYFWCEFCMSAHPREERDEGVAHKCRGTVDTCTARRTETAAVCTVLKKLWSGAATGSHALFTIVRQICTFFNGGRV